MVSYLQPAFSNRANTDYGARGGLKIQVGDNGLLNFNLQYLMGSGKMKQTGVPDIDIDTTDLNFTAGFSIYL